MDAKLIDLKSLLKLETFHCERSKFAGWERHFYVAVRVISPDLRKHLEYIEHHPKKSFKLAAFSEDERQLA